MAICLIKKIRECQEMNKVEGKSETEGEIIQTGYHDPGTLWSVIP